MISLCQEKSKADDDPFGDEPDDGQAFRPRYTFASQDMSISTAFANWMMLNDIEWYWIIFPMILNTHSNIDDIYMVI